MKITMLVCAILRKYYETSRSWHGAGHDGAYNLGHVQHTGIFLILYTILGQRRDSDFYFCIETDNLMCLQVKKSLSWAKSVAAKSEQGGRTRYTDNINHNRALVNVTRFKPLLLRVLRP